LKWNLFFVKLKFCLPMSRRPAATAVTTAAVSKAKKVSLFVSLLI
jgi:hypothetical protein